MNVIEAVTRVLETIGAPYAMIGARAVGVRGHPRMTIDYDFLTTDSRVLRVEVWNELIIERAQRVDLGGTSVPVPVTSDLILLKLAAGGPIDLQDVVALLSTDRERLTREVDEKVSQVRPDVTGVWNRIQEV